MPLAFASSGLVLVLGRQGPRGEDTQLRVLSRLAATTTLLLSPPASSAGAREGLRFLSKDSKADEKT